jgi:hypothetical protein
MTLGGLTSAYYKKLILKKRLEQKHITPQLYHTSPSHTAYSIVVLRGDVVANLEGL